jgi:UDP-3-O-[3-hydroxymyristoyl] glucosamine N-acyltransferase
MPTARRLDELARLVGGSVVGDESLAVDHVAAVDDAGPGTLTFAVDRRWLERAIASPAAAVVAPADAADVDRRGKTLLVVGNVRAALAAILAAFAPPVPRGEYTHPSAVIEEEVTREPDVYVAAGVIVRSGARLGSGCTLLGGCYVGRNVILGAGTLLHPRAVVLDDCVVGENCVLNAGCVIGSDGFGFARVGNEQIKIPQIGNVVLGDGVEIGACTTIDRAVTGSTVVGRGTKIDNLVQIGHNVQIGEDCTICAQTGIAGSTKLGNRVVLAGQVGVVDHVEVGDGTVAGASTKIISSWPAGSYISGDYAQPHHEHMKQQVLLRKLPKLFDQVRALMAAHDEASRKAR